MPKGELHHQKQGHFARTSLFLALCTMACVLALSGCQILGYTQVPAAAPHPTTTLTLALAEEGEEIPTPVPTDTVQPTITSTPTALPTDTPVPPTETPVPPTPTLALPTDTPVPPTDTPTPVPTATLDVPSPTPPCATTPQWGLGDVWQNPEVKDRLGCPTGPQLGVQGEEIYFQRGHMLWRPDNGLIYVLSAPYMPEGWGAFPDTLADGQVATVTPVPPTPRLG